MDPFPTEIWERIFAHFECPMPIDNWWDYGNQYDITSLKDLTSLSLVCRAFHLIARQFIYRTILAEAFEDSDRTKALLARSLSENPRLATYVRNVCLHSGELDDDAESSFENLVRDKDVEDRAKRWLRMRSMIESHTKLLAFMPNVQVVDCTLPMHAGHLAGLLSGRSDVEKVVQAEADIREEVGYLYRDDYKRLRALPATLNRETLADNALPQLREVRLLHGDSQDGNINVSEIEAVLLHPGLERVYLLGINWTSYGMALAKWPLQPCNTLQVLDLRECLVDASTFRNIFARFENLHTLQITLGDARRDSASFDGSEEVENTWDVDLEDIGAILREHGQRLISFELRTADYDAFSSAAGRVGSLKEMTSLRHLKIAECDLTGVRARNYVSEDESVLPLEDVLPASLETLYFHYDDHYFGNSPPDSRLVEILERALSSGRLPDLREVKVERYLDDPTCNLKDDMVFDGWEVSMHNVHLRRRVISSGCLRLIVQVTRVED